LRVRGEGEAGTAGRGDLYVIVEVRPNSLFHRDGNDILTEINISLSKAILGFDVDVPTLSGHVKMKVPAGTQPGKVFRLREKGMPDVHGGDHGDELVRVNVDIPSRLSAEQRRLIEEFARASGEEIGSESLSDKIKKKFR
jgi:molecular chaperone DnaJ